MGRSSGERDPGSKGYKIAKAPGGRPQRAKARTLRHRAKSRSPFSCPHRRRPLCKPRPCPHVMRSNPPAASMLHRSPSAATIRGDRLIPAVFGKSPGHRTGEPPQNDAAMVQAIELPPVALAKGPRAHAMAQAAATAAAPVRRGRLLSAPLTRDRVARMARLHPFPDRQRGSAFVCLAGP